MAIGRWIPGYELDGKSKRLAALAKYNKKPRVKTVQGAILFHLKRKAMNAKQVGQAIGISANRAAQELGYLLEKKEVVVIDLQQRISDKPLGRKTHSVRVYKAKK